MNREIACTSLQIMKSIRLHINIYLLLTYALSISISAEAIRLKHILNNEQQNILSRKLHSTELHANIDELRSKSVSPGHGYSDEDTNTHTVDETQRIVSVDARQAPYLQTSTNAICYNFPITIAAGSQWQLSRTFYQQAEFTEQWYDKYRFIERCEIQRTSDDTTDDDLEIDSEWIGYRDRNFRISG